MSCRQERSWSSHGDLVGSSIGRVRNKTSRGMHGHGPFSLDCLFGRFGRWSYLCLNGLIYTIDLLGSEASSARVTDCGTLSGLRSPRDRQENVRTTRHRRLSQPYQAAGSPTRISRDARWQLVFLVTIRRKSPASAERSPFAFDVRVKTRRGGI